jgi:hypothetical protein
MGRPKSKTRGEIMGDSEETVIPLPGPVIEERAPLPEGRAGEGQAAESASTRARKPSRASAADRVAALQAALAEAKAAAKEAEKRKAAIVGRVVLDAIATDETFRAAVVATLRTASLSARDKADIAELFI